MLLRYFVNFYDMEIIEEEAFLAWKEDITQEFPGKGKALFQVQSFFFLIVQFLPLTHVIMEQWNGKPAFDTNSRLPLVPPGEPVANLAGDGGGGGVRGRRRLRSHPRSVGVVEDRPYLLLLHLPFLLLNFMLDLTTTTTRHSAASDLQI